MVTGPSLSSSTFKSYWVAVLLKNIEVGQIYVAAALFDEGSRIPDRQRPANAPIFTIAGLSAMPEISRDIEREASNIRIYDVELMPLVRIGKARDLGAIAKLIFYCMGGNANWRISVKAIDYAVVAVEIHAIIEFYDALFCEASALNKSIALSRKRKNGIPAIIPNFYGFRAIKLQFPVIVDEADKIIRCTFRVRDVSGVLNQAILS